MTKGPPSKFSYNWFFSEPTHNFPNNQEATPQVKLHCAVSVMCVLPRETTRLRTLYLELIKAGPQRQKPYFSPIVVSDITKGIPIHDTSVKWLQLKVSKIESFHSLKWNSWLVKLQGARDLGNIFWDAQLSQARHQSSTFLHCPGQ